MRRKITKDAVKHANKILELYEEQENKIDDTSINELKPSKNYEDLLDKRHFESWAQPDELDHHNHPYR